MNLILPIVTHPVYIVACVLVGLIWRRRRTGFVGTTLLCFLLTPLLFPLFLYVTGPAKPSDPEAELEAQLEAELEKQLAEQRAAEAERELEAERARGKARKAGLRKPSLARAAAVEQPTHAAAPDGAAAEESQRPAPASDAPVAEADPPEAEATDEGGEVPAPLTPRA